MKNSEIHTGLENSNLRDFFAISLGKGYRNEIENKQETIIFRSDETSWLDHSIKCCERDILYNKKRLSILKEQQAILTLIKMQGWSEFDVSDETKKDLEFWINFIGTKEEYEQLIKRIEAEK